MAETVPLLQVAYVSQATRAPTRGLLDDLLRVSRSNNRRDDITGLLLVDRTLFFQVLEGPEESVRRLLDVLRTDHRHAGLEVVHEEPLSAGRDFAEWWMACQVLGDPDAEDYRRLDDRVKRILRAATPEGPLAAELLTRFQALDGHSGEP